MGCDGGVVGCRSKGFQDNVPGELGGVGVHIGYRGRSGRSHHPEMCPDNVFVTESLQMVSKRQ